MTGFFTNHGKQTLFFRVLGRLKERNAYFTFKDIQTGADKERLTLKDSSLKVYLSEALKRGLIHDAGRGWYSRLNERPSLNPKLVSRLIRSVEKAFPLLDFSVWSTAQLNPWMRHLIAQPVGFLNVPSDALESVGETLEKQGWAASVDPAKKAASKIVRPGERTVVLRPMHSKEPAGQGRQTSIEKILVDLVLESGRLALMDPSEAQGVASEIANRNLVEVATVHRYAEFRGVNLALFGEINQRHHSKEGGAS